MTLDKNYYCFFFLMNSFERLTRLYISTDPNLKDVSAEYGSKCTELNWDVFF